MLPNRSVSEFAVTAIIGYLGFWRNQEVVIKCDQTQGMKKIAQLLQGRRRPRRMVAKYSLETRRPSNCVMVRAHHQLVGPST